MAVPVLHLDPEIRVWVLLPILVTMFVIAILQDNLRVLLLSGPARVSRARLLRDHVLQRSTRLRNACGVLPDDEAFRRKRAYFTNTTNGWFSRSLNETAADGFMLKLTLPLLEAWGPGAGGAMLKQYALNFVPTILLGVFVNHFFSGFIVAKLPFSLPSSFRYMLHSGVMLPELDACYVSSLSWYFLALMGVRNLAALLTDWMQDYQTVQLQEVAQQSPIVSTMLLGMPIMGSGGPSDEQMARLERDNLHVTRRDPAFLDEAEKRLLAL